VESSRVDNDDLEPPGTQCYTRHPAASKRCCGEATSIRTVCHFLREAL